MNELTRPPAPQDRAPQDRAPQDQVPPHQSRDQPGTQLQVHVPQEPMAPKGRTRRARKALARKAEAAEATQTRALALADARAGGQDGGRRSLALSPPDPRRHRDWRPGMFGVLDIGTSKVTCLIGRGEPDGTLRVMGCGWQRSRGVRLGGITDLREAERAIRAAVGQAEEAADHHLRSVTVSLTCGQPESRLFNVRWPVGGRVIADADIRRIVSEGRHRAATDGREIIHALPLGFIVDEVGGVEDPRGHHCDQLAARLHVIDAGAMALRNLAAVIARCDLGITELVAAPFASGLSVLADDERELGCSVIDMGGGTTQLAMFAENQLLHTAQLPVGGLHVTKDIAHMLSTPLGSAERLKVVFGNAEVSSEDEREILQVQQIGVDEHSFNRMPRSKVVRAIRPRLEETFELLRDRLDSAGVGRAAAERVVLTGGASQLDGVQRLASRVLDRKVRLGVPTNIRGLPADAGGPGFATASGLLAFAAGSGRTLHDIDLSEPRPSGLLRRLVDLLREYV
ncbi:cell division protein FtsA [Lichenicoccus sp.]|uniref:cell division protein FtsA n=1 Tax=Lichenicoccus sp. TaxID=2781899 RepID=UPI003D09AC2A